MIKVYLIDDHEVVLEGLNLILAQKNDFEVIGQAASGREALEDPRLLGSDVVVLDLELEGMSGMEVLRRLKARLPGLKVIIFSMHDSSVCAPKATELGAAAYLRKDRPPAVLIEMIRRVIDGEIISNHLSSPGSVDTQIGPGARTEILSERELEILQLVAQGLAQKVIAYKLNLSVSTVGTYVSRIKNKLGLSSLIELARYAQSRNLV